MTFATVGCGDESGLNRTEAASNCPQETAPVYSAAVEVARGAVT